MKLSHFTVRFCIYVAAYAVYVDVDAYAAYSDAYAYAVAAADYANTASAAADPAAALFEMLKKFVELPSHLIISR